MTQGPVDGGKRKEEEDEIGGAREGRVIEQIKSGEVKNRK